MRVFRKLEQTEKVETLFSDESGEEFVT
jgi:hypothetical protein